MSVSSKDPDRRQEIIIVRRKKSGGDGHHGGAWKIAFADFMTAMMALFLVLWLVNAADQETKKTVASYFNPVKLVDRHSSQKGLSSATGPAEKANSDGQSDEDVSADDAAASQSEGQEGQAATTAFFENADLIIEDMKAEAALQKEMMEVSQPDQLMANQAKDGFGDGGPERLRDPFSTDIFVRESPDFEVTVSLPKNGKSSSDDVPITPASFEPRAAEALVETREPLKDRPALPPEISEEDLAKLAATEENPKMPEVGEAEAMETLSETVLDALSVGEEDGSVRVVDTEEGTVISLLDTQSDPMFQRSSAYPTGALLGRLQSLAEALNGSREGVRISGHTDAATFTAGSGYDNWRLSTDRAHAARLILQDAGFDAARITSVSGQGARQLLLPEEPFAAANRRIEILLERGS